MRRLLKILIISLLIILVPIAALILLLIWGFQIKEVEYRGTHFKGVELKILSGISISELKYQDGELMVQISESKIQWDFPEVFQKRLGSITINSIRIDPPSSQEKKEVQSPHSTKPNFPSQLPLEIRSVRIKKLYVKGIPYELKDIQSSLSFTKLRFSAGIQNQKQERLFVENGVWELPSQKLQADLHTSGFMIDHSIKDGKLNLSLQGKSHLSLLDFENLNSSVNFKGDLHLDSLLGERANSKFSLQFKENWLDLELSELEIQFTQQEILKSSLSMRCIANREFFQVGKIEIGAGSLGSTHWDSGYFTSRGRMDFSSAEIQGQILGTSVPMLEIATLDIGILLRNQNIVDTRGEMSGIQTTLAGILDQVEFQSHGGLDRQSGSLHMRNYTFQKSKIPSVETTFSWRPENLQLNVGIPQATIFPREYLNILSSLPDQKDSTSEQELPFQIHGRVHSNETEGISIKDENFQFQILPNLQFDATGRLGGGFRVTGGYLMVSNTKLELLEEGWVRFWPSESKGQVMKTTSLGSFPVESMELPEFSVGGSAEDMGLRSGVEIRLILGASRGEDEIKARISGFYPAINIEVEGMSPLEVVQALKGFFNGFGMGGSGFSPSEGSMGSFITQKAMEKASDELQDMLNKNLSGAGMKIKAQVLDDGGSDLSIEKKLGKKFLLELQQIHQKEMETIRTKKLQYLLNGSGSIFIRVDEKGGSGQEESAIGIQKKIKF